MDIKIKPLGSPNNAHCAYCRGPFESALTRAQCPQCSTFIHNSCLLYSNQCPSPGCGLSRVEMKKLTAAQDEAPEPTPEAPKHACSHCSKPRETGLSRCEHCGLHPTVSCYRCGAATTFIWRLAKDDLPEALKTVLEQSALETLELKICIKCRKGAAKLN